MKTFMFYLLVLAYVLMFLHDADAKMLHNENYYNTILCEKLCGKKEFVLNDKTSVDCLTTNEDLLLWNYDS